MSRPASVLLLAAACSLLFPATASAADPAAEAVERARAALEGGDGLTALEVIGEAAEAHPRDPGVYLAYGAILARQGIWPAALLRLQRARELGADAPELHLELGRTLIGLQREEEALLELEAAGETGEARALAGAALLALERAEEALPRFDEAIRLDPALEPRVRLLRASALAALGRDEAVAEEVDRGRVAAAGTEWERYYETLPTLGPREELPVPQRWGLRVTLGTGYNTNVKLRSDDATGELAKELSDEEDLFVFESVDAWCQFLGDERDGLLVRLRGSGNQYFDLNDYDDLHFESGLVGFHTRAPFRLEAGLGGSVSFVDCDDYSRVLDAFVTGRWWQGERSRTSLTYRTWARNYTFDGGLEEEDPDGRLHRLELRQELVIPVRDRIVRLDPYLEVGKQEAEGASSDNRFAGAGVHIRLPLPGDVEPFLWTSFRYRPYDNDQVRTGFTERRRDRDWSLGAGVRVQVDEGIEAVLSWMRTDRDSTLSEWFSFDQNVFSLAFTFTFP